MEAHMKTTKKWVAGLLVIALLFTAVPVMADDSAMETSDPDLWVNQVFVERVSGSNRYETALKLAEENWLRSDDMVLASGENSADALYGGPLASALKAPMILTPKDKLPEGFYETAEELGTMLIYVLGGENSVSKEITDELMQKGYAVVRLGGANRFETASKIAKTVADFHGMQTGGDQYIWTNPNEFADALAAAPFAYYARSSAEYGGHFLPYNGGSGGKVIGGTNSIPELEYEQLRISGANRYETAVEIAKTVQNKLNPEIQVVYLANGMDYPDALAACPVATEYDGVILLTPADKLHEATKAFIAESGIRKVFIIGGENSVSEQVEDEVKEILNID